MESISISDKNEEKNRCLYCFIFFCLLFIAACASTPKPNVSRVWMNEEYTGQGINKVLVLGITDKMPTRRMFEDQFVSQLKKKGVEAIASSRIILVEGELSRDNIQSKAETFNVDTILITKVVGKKLEEIAIKPSNATQTAQYTSQGYIEHYKKGYRLVHSPISNKNNLPNTKRYEVLNLETNLYEIKNEKLIISIQSDLEALDSTESLIRSYIDMAIKELSKRNLINK